MSQRGKSIERKPLSVNEIAAITERRKAGRRMTLEKEMIKLIKKYEKEDVLHIFGLLTYKMTK